MRLIFRAYRTAEIESNREFSHGLDFNLDFTSNLRMILKLLLLSKWEKVDDNHPVGTQVN